MLSAAGKSVRWHCCFVDHRCSSTRRDAQGVHLSTTMLPRSTMLSGPAEIPPKHFCKKSGNKLVCDFLVGDVRFGSKADICGAPTHVRFTPIATAKADLPQWSCLLHPNGGHVRCSSLCLLWAKSGHQAARAIRVSISPRSAAKSMGLVRSASAPFSRALRLVSASP